MLTGNRGQLVLLMFSISATAQAAGASMPLTLAKCTGAGPVHLQTAPHRAPADCPAPCTCKLPRTVHLQTAPHLCTADCPRSFAFLTSAPIRHYPISLFVCGVDNQTFRMATIAPYTLPAAVASAQGVCLEIDAKEYGASAGTAVVASACGHNPINYRANQYWRTSGNTLQSLQVRTTLCFGVAEGIGGLLTDCRHEQAQFMLNLQTQNGSAIIQRKSGLCVSTVGIPPPPPPPPPPPTPDPPNMPCPTRTPSLAVQVPGPTMKGGLPCDLYAAAETPCVAAHSTTRALYSAYRGPLYLVIRSSDGASQIVSTRSTGGIANASSQDEFCKQTYCSIEIVFDQSTKGNHLRANHPGRHHPTNRGVNASALPVNISGQRVYGMKFDPGMGYRDDDTSGLAVGDEPESMYAVMGGHHYNDLCCFDYGE